MSGTVVQRLLYPLHLAVLASLHAALATTRATRLALRLLNLFLAPFQRQTDPCCPAEDLATRRWAKIPRHLAVSLVATPSGSILERLEARRHVDVLQSLLSWSRQLGIATLSVYDETGALLRHATGHAEALDLRVISSEEETKTEGIVTLVESWSPMKSEVRQSSPDGTPTPRSAQEDASADSGTTLVADEAPPAPLRVNLVSRAAGRPRLARLAQDLAVQSHQTGAEVKSERVSEVADSLPLGEPDLLLVLGGSYLRLHGFPPWQLRLTEMYHHSWPTWFSKPPELTYNILRRALDVYGRAEMRLGR
ncbi:hypothetical protein BMF94_0675 [Rhodotorula taiwanensis]|uniref:ditrans,polycis-polyprenyl diphosphate synthase [(2E,6E)-farnesyldiphosphate specific] n=1 Tax=Rhodotorula taiwanensis TaxID=741276 RepID=A0A2S5BI93_9BASI|nr:hypothetical protein BMF94_0675 [Rhodotorula taiwanensis]